MHSVCYCGSCLVGGKECVRGKKVVEFFWAAEGFHFGSKIPFELLFHMLCWVLEITSERRKKGSWFS